MDFRVVKYFYVLMRAVHNALGVMRMLITIS